MKKGISVLLVLAMILSIGMGLPVEAYADDTGLVSIVPVGTYTQREGTQEITIRITPNVTEAYDTFAIGTGVTIPDGFTIKSYSTSNTAQPIAAGDYNVSDGMLTYLGMDNEGKPTIPANTTYDLVLTAPAGAKGDFTVTFMDLVVATGMGTVELVPYCTVEAQFTISTPVAPADKYEIWYELDQPDGTDGDHFHEYAYDADVYANVYIKNNTGADVKLQAYDFYLQYDATNLTCAAFDPEYDEKGAVVENTNGQARIQAIGENTKVADINIVLPKNGDSVKLGAIAFTINNEAEYEAQLPITLLPTLGEASTNIAVADVDADGNDTGNKTSYYPGIIGDNEGVEVNTTYEISWVNEGTTLKTETVGRNKVPSYVGETPTKEGADGKTYTFKEWTPAIVKATTDATYTATYTEEVNTYTVTWKDWNDDVLGTTTVEHGETPVYSGTPTRTEDNQYTYTFKAWTPTIVAATKAAEYTATYTATPKTYQITFNVGEGSLPDGYTSPMDYNCDQSTLLPLPTRDGYAFNGWLLTTTVGGWDAKTYYTTDTVNGKWGDVTLVAQWLDAEFDVTIGTTEHGSVTATPMGGAEGDTITLNASPDPGYKLDRYIVTHTDDPAQTVDVAADGTFKLPAADVTVTATFVLDDLTVNVENPTDANGTVSADKDIAQFGDTVTLSNDPDDGYELKEYKVIYDDGTGEKTVNVTVDPTTGKGTFTMPAYPVTVTATFQKKDLVITIDPTIQNGSVEAQKDSVKTETAKLGETVTLVVNPNNGYKLVTDSLSVTKTGDSTQTVPVTDGTFTMPEYPVTVTAQFELDIYTITFDLDGGNDLTGDFANNQRTYKITDTWALPTPTKANYVFNGWKVKETVGSWTKDAVHGPGTTNLNQAYGNVTLVAQWIPRGDLKVEEYKYAADGYVMLRVADAGLAADQVYQFGTGADATMYYTTDSNYLVEDSNATGVYYTLISKAYAEKQTDENGNVLKDENGIELITGKLTTEGLKLLQAVPGLPASINYDTGDINGDEKTNIADANIVYQMIVNGGGYYGDLKITERLAADMNRAAEGVHRGSIEDVAAIVAIINGTN